MYTATNIPAFLDHPTPPSPDPPTNIYTRNQVSTQMLVKSKGLWTSAARLVINN